MKIRYFEVHSFTETVGGGNPAGVCPLDEWPGDTDMLRIAAEKNLSEIAFFVSEAGDIRLRWFAPGGEVDLCGHATLAAAHVLFGPLGYKMPQIRFQTKSGPLIVSRQGSRYVMDFPELPVEPIPAPHALIDGLGQIPLTTLKGMDYIAVFKTEDDIRAMNPNFAALRRLDLRGVVVTSPGITVDYVCRCFAPNYGIEEDPVTGSVQCALAPYWSKKTGKKSFRVAQLSQRGGSMTCELKNGRVFISGAAVLHHESTVEI